jgi:hypothetical protein
MGTIECWLTGAQPLKRAASRLRRTPETPADRAIREEGERIRRVFPSIDFDRPGSRQVYRPDDV